MSTETEASLGEGFAAALGEKDFERIRTILEPDVDFRGLTPNRTWAATDAHTLVDEILARWFEPSDQIEEVLSVQTDRFSDCRRVAYRFRGHSDGQPFVVEQQAYYRERNGRIGWLRILCSGFRPV